MFEEHYHEEMPRHIKRFFDEINNESFRETFRQNLVMQNITWDGNKPVPVSLMPRILPKDYEPVIERACRLITESIFNLAYSKSEVLKLPGLSSTLVDELHILDYLPKKIIGSARYDLAICGKPSTANPPRLLELNMLDYGGAGWVPGINDSLLKSANGLSDLVYVKDIVDGMVTNLRNLGRSVLFVYEDDFSYADFNNFERDIYPFIRVCAMQDKEFFTTIRNKKAYMGKDGISLKINGKDRHFDFIYLRALSTIEEINNAKDITQAMLQSQVPMYDSFLGLLLENKSALSLFVNSNSPSFARKIFLDSCSLDEKLSRTLLNNPKDSVLKHSDGHFGSTVFVEEEMLPILKNIKDYSGWCIQDFVKLNTSNVWPLGKDSFEGIVDLAVFVNYIWNSEKPLGKRLEHCSVGGYLCRSSSNNFKVNVSSGGCFVPLFFSYS